MVVKVGINGFGRIGKTIFRLAVSDPEIQVVQINDLMSTATLAHLLKYDTVHGTFEADIEASEGALSVNGQKIHCSEGRHPKEIDWSSSGVDVVLECTGFFCDRESSAQHLGGSVKKVIISAPGKNCDATIVMGVNEKTYHDSQQVISNASCTTNCLAPVAKVIHENLKIKRGFMTTIHSYTNDQRVLCGPHKDLRRARTAALNQIPTSTGAAKAVGLVLPELAGKLDGLAIRVPTPNVSLVDLVVDIEKSTDVTSLRNLFKEASNGTLKGILNYSEEPLVSSDYNGCKFSSTVDGLTVNVMKDTFVKVLAWYDNETGFSQRMIDLAKYIQQDTK